MGLYGIRIHDFCDTGAALLTLELNKPSVVILWIRNIPVNEHDKRLK